MVTKATDAVIDREYELELVDGADVSTDLTAFIQKLYDDQATGELPSGDFYLDTLVDLTFSGSAVFTLRGSSKGATRLIVKSGNTDGGISIECLLRSNKIEISDLTIVPESQSAFGLSVVQPEGGQQPSRTLTLDNVSVELDWGNNYRFSEPIIAKGQWGPLYRNVNIGTRILTGLVREDSSVLYSPLNMFNAEGNYNPEFYNVGIWGGTNGINLGVFEGTITSFADNGSGGTRVTVSETKHPFSTGAVVIVSGSGVGAYDNQHTITRISDTEFDIPVTFVSDPGTGSCYLEEAGEGAIIQGGIINGCRNCIRWRRPGGREPTLWIRGFLHLNYLVTGIEVDGCKMFMMNGVNIYHESGGSGTASTPRDIWLKNCSEFTINENTHHFTGEPDRRILQVADNGTAGSGENGIYKNNIISGQCNEGIVCDAGTSNIVATENIFTLTPTTAISVDTSGNNYLQTDLVGREIAGTWTPTISFGGASVGVAYTTQTGIWKVTGNILKVNLEIELTSKGSSSGEINVSLPTNLPGGKSIDANVGHLVAVLYSGMSSVSDVKGRPITTSALRLFQPNATITSALTNTNITDTGRVILSGTLEIS